MKRKLATAYPATWSTDCETKAPSSYLRGSHGLVPSTCLGDANVGIRRNILNGEFTTASCVYGLADLGVGSRAPLLHFVDASAHFLNALRSPKKEFRRARIFLYSVRFPAASTGFRITLMMNGCWRCGEGHAI